MNVGINRVVKYFFVNTKLFNYKNPFLKLLFVLLIDLILTVCELYKINIFS